MRPMPIHFMAEADGAVGAGGGGVLHSAPRKVFGGLKMFFRGLRQSKTVYQWSLWRKERHLDAMMEIERLKVWPEGTREISCTRH